MYPVLFKIAGLSVYSYGFMIAFAFLFCTYLGQRSALKHGFPRDLIVNSALVILFSGIIGARILYVAINIKSYINDPIEIIMLPHGGLAFYGGAITAIAAQYIYIKVRKIPVYKFADFIIPYAVLGQAIGRIGCFLNGCCYGRQMDASHLYPTQLYSSFLLFGLYFFLKFIQKLKPKPGVIMVSYGILYSIGRFFMEFLRGDNTVFIVGLTFSQFVGVIVFAVSVSLLLFERVPTKSGRVEKKT